MQEMCAGLGITELESTADFPYDMVGAPHTALLDTPRVHRALGFISA